MTVDPYGRTTRPQLLDLAGRLRRGTRPERAASWAQAASDWTTFHFVTEGIEAALERAREAAGDRHVRLGGGVSTVRQYLRAGLVDELHVAVVPVLLGRGERLFGDLGDALDGWTCVEFTPSVQVAHVRLRRG